MEVTRRGKVNYPGDLNVKGVLDSAIVTTKDLNVSNNITVTKDLNVEGKTIITGDATVKGVLDSAIVTTKDLNVSNNVTVTKDLNVGGKTIITGDLIVTGNILNDNVKTETREEFDNGEIYLGDKTQNGGWRIRIEESELLIEKLENNEWEIKQSMS